VGDAAKNLGNLIRRVFEAEPPPPAADTSAELSAATWRL
jgi:hypothetical protein